MMRPASEPRIGDYAIGFVTPDGSVYAGISPDTGKPMYAMPADAPLALTFNEAIQHAKGHNRVKTCGHDDWRVPTRDELHVLFNNRAAIGGFNETPEIFAGWYRSSSSTNEWGAWGQRFSDGRQINLLNKNYHSSLRLVRDGP